MSRESGDRRIADPMKWIVSHCLACDEQRSWCCWCVESAIVYDTEGSIKVEIRKSEAVERASSDDPVLGLIGLIDTNLRALSILSKELV